ncbi:MAG: TonB-dependent receptor [Haliscomenobacteraceae bacterium CHB4]|nr:TonB-dependent receptor [Haliscomenobacteraceae bacterium CHB4]
MAKLFTFLLFVFISISLPAQITGRVTDAAGEGLAGVSIKVKGAGTGTTTDVEGNYRLAVSDGVLEFSYTGFATQEIAVAGRTVIDVVMSEAVTTLESVVVVGYGTQKKKDITTAVVIVDEEAIKDRPMVSAAEALQGKAAGVQVVQPSGKPGNDIAVRVRGSTSVLAGNEPLYVVDGVPTTDIRGLNPTDIESMSVLKDASSAAIYGARAANGVVLITTKRGKENTSVVRFNTYAGVSDLRKTVDVLTTKRYRELIEEIIPGSLDPAATGYTNWSDEVFGYGNIQNYQLAFSGGTEKSRYLVSAAYLNQDGIVRPAKFDRISLRVNLDNQVKDWLKVGTNINMLRARTKDTPDNASSGRGGVIMSALNTPPFLSIYKKDGSGQFDPNPFQPSWENPVAYMEGPDQEQSDNRLFGNVNAEATIVEGLTVKTNFGTDLNAHQWDYYLDPFRTNFGRNQNGLGRSDKSNTNSWLWENTAHYATSFGKNNMTFLAGSSIQKLKWSDSYIEGNDFPADVSVKTLNAANNVFGNTSIEEWSLASFFGRVTYDFESKYLLTATVRRDGSSKLAHHWGTMPSFSAGWRISAEPFMQGLDFIYDMKLRVGWGKNGNQEGIPNYARYGLVSYYRRASTNPLSGPAAVQVTYGNPDLKWETTAQSNVGIDLSMWNGRVTFIADAYIKKTDDVLLNVQLSNSLPISTIQTNAGKIENKGLEFALSTVNLVRAFRWNTEFNISFNKNKVTDLQYTDVYYFGRVYSNNQDVAIVREGLPLGSFFGYVSEGVDPETGDLKYKDVNENGIFDPGDRTVIGNAQPKFTFGFTNALSWKRFDLNIFFQGSYGNDIYNATRIDLEGMFDSKNQSTAVLRRWTPDNRNTDIPRAVGNGNVDNVRNSTRFVEDGSYVRLKAVTLTYNINPAGLKRLGIEKLSVYSTGQNLLTFTNYSGFDPEVNAFGRSATELGIDYGTYPQARTLIVGLNVDF